MITIRNKRTGEVRQVDEKDMANYRISQPTEVAQQPQQSSPLASLIPLLGSLIGGGLGTLVAPGVGTIAGSAIGGGLGETARQGFGGQKLQVGKIAGETALGGLGGGLGVLLKGFRPAMAASKAAGSVDDLAKLGVNTIDDSSNVLQKMGRRFTTNTVNPKVVPGLNQASKAEEIVANQAKYGLAGTPATKITQIDKLANIRYDKLDDIAAITTKTIDGKTLRGNILKKLVDQGFSGTEYDSKIKSILSTIPKGKVDLKTLVNLKRNLGKQLSGAFKALEEGKTLVPRQEVGIGIWGGIDDGITTISPKTKNITTQLHELHGLLPGYNQLANDSYKIPFVNMKSKALMEGFLGAEEGLGKLLTGAGNLAAKSPVSGSQFIGQGVAQGAGALARPSGVPEGYESGQNTATPVSDYSTQDSSPLAGLTKEKVALARLILPDKQADAIEAAYKIMQSGEEEKDLTEAQVARRDSIGAVDQAIELLRTNPNIKTGMIGGPLENFKAKFGAADNDSLQFNYLISGLVATIAKARAGTSFTPNEEKMLRAYAPQVGDSKQELTNKLIKLQEGWERNK